MPKLLGENAKRVHLWLWESDIERLDALCAASEARLTRSDMLRQIIHSTLNKLEAKSNERARSAIGASADLTLSADPIPAGSGGPLDIK